VVGWLDTRGGEQGTAIVEGQPSRGQVWNTEAAPNGNYCQSLGKLDNAKEISVSVYHYSENLFILTRESLRFSAFVPSPL